MNKSRTILLFSLSLVIVFFAGCATSTPVKKTSPFSILGNSASYYLVLPVSTNRALLDLFLSKQKDSVSFQKAVERTDVVYAGLYIDHSIRLMGTGSFPKVASLFLFPQSRGWEKKRGENSFSWYHSERFDAAIPKSGMVCISTGNSMETILQNMNRPEMIQMSPSFSDYISRATLDGRIGLYVSDTSEMVSYLVGPDITLPIEYAEVYAEKTALNDYSLSVTIKLQDVRTARAMMALLRLTVKRDLVLEGETVYIRSYPLTAEKLVEMTENLYLNK